MPSDRHATAFHRLAFYDETLKLKCLARDTKNVKLLDKRRYDGRTALHVAADRGNINMIRAILGAGSKAINTADDIGVTPLLCALEKRHAKVVDLLLERGSLDFKERYKGVSLLHLAIMGKDPACVAVIAKRCPSLLDVPTEDDRETPLFFAVKRGYIKIVALLLRLGCKSIDTPNKKKVTPLMLALSLQFDKTVSLLMTHGASHSHPGYSKLAMFCRVRDQLENTRRQALEAKLIKV